MWLGQPCEDPWEMRALYRGAGVHDRRAENRPARGRLLILILESSGYFFKVMLASEKIQMKKGRNVS
jgi:hypothetical protein